MERTVSKAQAHKTMEEQKQLQADIDEKQRELNESQKQLEMLEKSNNQLQDEKRNIDRIIKKVRGERDNLQTQIGQLKLENEMAGHELEKVKKNKEKTLVQHDCKKLEIKQLRETVNLEADQVYGLENRKYQLEMSMEEREKEI